MIPLDELQCTSLQPALSFAYDMTATFSPPSSFLRLSLGSRPLFFYLTKIFLMPSAIANLAATYGRRVYLARPIGCHFIRPS